MSSLGLSCSCNLIDTSAVCVLQTGLFIRGCLDEPIGKHLRIVAVTLSGTAGEQQRIAHAANGAAGRRPVGCEMNVVTSFPACLLCQPQNRAGNRQCREAPHRTVGWGVQALAKQRAALQFPVATWLILESQNGGVHSHLVATKGMPRCIRPGWQRPDSQVRCSPVAGIGCRNRSLRRGRGQWLRGLR